VGLDHTCMVSTLYDFVGSQVMYCCVQGL